MLTFRILLIFFFFFTINFNINAQIVVPNQSTSSGCVGFDFGCTCPTINLTIYNGLAGATGGQAIVDQSDLLEETQGAVTVANLNDTDGDGDINNDGIIEVFDKDDNSVTSSLAGRDEVDLMQLVIESDGEAEGDCPQVVTLLYSGNIKFWRNPTKGTQITNLTFDVNTLPKTLWVEATDVSSSIRDITIQAQYDGNINDTVKATAIWANKAIKYVSSNTPDPFGITSIWSHIYDRVDNNGNFYGLGYFNNNLTESVYGGRILMEFEILPSGVEVLPIYFDMTRRLNEDSGTMTSGTNTFTNTSDDSFALQNEMPNDDSHNDDTDASPTTMYVYDAPAGQINPNYPSNSSTTGFKYWIGEFEEFARVSFSPIQPNNGSGETIIGSRCSEITQWEHGRCLRLVSSASDAYDTSTQNFEVIPSGVTHSIPARISGSGNGNISINYLSGISTEGYSILFSNGGTTCSLYNAAGLIDSKSLLNNQWTLIDPNKITINIQNNSANPYVDMTLMYFSVINEPTIFNDIGIQ